MTIIFGLIFTLACIGGSFVAMGGHLEVLMQPYEYVIILGAGLGAFIVANSTKVIKDTLKAVMEAMKNAVPKPSDYIDVLSLLYSEQEPEPAVLLHGHGEHRGMEAGLHDPGAEHTLSPLLEAGGHDEEAAGDPPQGLAEGLLVGFSGAGARVRWLVHVASQRRALCR